MNFGQCGLEDHSLSPPPFHDTLCEDCRRIDLSTLLLAPNHSTVSSFEPASAYEDKAAIFVNHFYPNNDLKSHNCSLYTLLAECARRAGIDGRLSRVRCCLRPKLRWSHTPASNSALKGVPESQLKHSGQIHVWFQELKTLEPVRQGFPMPSASRPSTPSTQDLLASIRHRAESKQRLLSEFRLRSRNRPFQPPEVPELGPTAASTSNKGNEPKEIPGQIREILSGEELKVKNFKPAVAPWMIDVIGSDSSGPTAIRAPIPPITDVNLLRQWLYECNTKHLHPQQPLNQYSRIGEVLRRGVLRAINTTTGEIKTQDSLVPFVALSYVWGQTAHLTPSLESKSIADYAPSIRDAAELARSMDIAWLWVDRMCIDQSDEAEKTFLIPYIKDIFAVAQLTIISAAGDGAHNGLPGTKGTPREKESMVEVMNGPEKFSLLPCQPSFNALYEPCVWRRRGWTFEEQVFSSRVLYIFPTEMIFSCCKGTFRESSRLHFSSGAAGFGWGDNGATPPIVAAEINAKIHSALPGSGYSLSARDFGRAVEEYTSRSLTVEGDRVVAFAGLITISAGNHPSNQFPERALLKHGHPPQFFETALTWQHEENFQKRQPRNEKPFVPSWSWASAGTKIRFLDNGEENGRSCFFNFTCLDGHDVLAIPRQSFFVPKRFALAEPLDILLSQPWMRNRSVPLSCHEAASPLLQVPSLHMVTVVFDGNFARQDKDVHSLVGLGDSHDQDARLQGRWSVDIDNRTEAGSPAGKLFAIVAGKLNIFVMALQPTSEENIYTRYGLFPVSVSSHRTLFAIMRGGNLRWQYVSIV